MTPRSGQHGRWASFWFIPESTTDIVAFLLDGAADRARVPADKLKRSVYNCNPRSFISPVSNFPDRRPTPPHDAREALVTITCIVWNDDPGQADQQRRLFQ
jgi:hypothetical protein